MLTILHGPDRYSSFQRLRSLLDGRPYELIEASEYTEVGLRDQLLARDLFGNRLLVIQDLFARVGKEFLPTLVSISQDQALRYIVRERQVIPTIWKGLIVASTIEDFPMLTGTSLLRFIRSQAEYHQVMLDASAAQALAVMSRGDLATISTLLAGQSKQVVTKSILNELLGVKDQGVIFSFLDALCRQDQHALVLLEQCKSQGQSSAYLITMIAWQIRQLLLVASGETAGIKPFVRQKMKRLLALRPSSAYQQLFDALLALEVQLKTGLLNEEVGLDSFVISALYSTK